MSEDQTNKGLATMNEAFVKAILDNASKEDAIKKIAYAITNRDIVIRKLRQVRK